MHYQAERLHIQEPQQESIAKMQAHSTKSSRTGGEKEVGTPLVMKTVNLNEPEQLSLEGKWPQKLVTNISDVNHSSGARNERVWPGAIKVVEQEKSLKQHRTEHDPVRPCLKRGQSCFIRRSDGPDKCVTFRSLSSTGSGSPHEEVSHTEFTKLTSLDARPELKTLLEHQTPCKSNGEKTSGIRGPQFLQHISSDRSSVPTFIPGYVSNKAPDKSVVHQTEKPHRRWSVHTESREMNFEITAQNQNSSPSGAFLARRTSLAPLSSRSLLPSVGDETPLKTNGVSVSHKSPVFGSYAAVTERSVAKTSGISEISKAEEITHKKKEVLHDTAESQTQEGIQEDKETNPEEMCTVAGAGPGLDEARLQKSHWSKVRQVTLSGRFARAFGQESRETMVSKPDEVKQIQTDTSRPRQTDPTKQVSRKPGTENRVKPTNVDPEVQGEAQKATTSLIEDPILVKISKKNKNVGKFTSKPKPIPNAVCFEIHGAHLSHGEVKVQVEELLRTCPEVNIDCIRFHHRSLINNEKEMDNRWIIVTNCATGRNRLAGNNLNFDGEIVQLQRYDDVISAEYQQFLRMANFVKMMNSRKILT